MNGLLPKRFVRFIFPLHSTGETDRARTRVSPMIELQMSSLRTISTLALNVTCLYVLCASGAPTYLMAGEELGARERAEVLGQYRAAALSLSKQLSAFRATASVETTEELGFGRRPPDRVHRKTKILECFVQDAKYKLLTHSELERLKTNRESKALQKNARSDYATIDDGHTNSVAAKGANSAPYWLKSRQGSDTKAARSGNAVGDINRYFKPHLSCLPYSLNQAIESRRFNVYKIERISPSKDSTFKFYFRLEGEGATHSGWWIAGPSHNWSIVEFETRHLVSRATMTRTLIIHGAAEYSSAATGSIVPVSINTTREEVIDLKQGPAMASISKRLDGEKRSYSRLNSVARILIYELGTTRESEFTLSSIGLGYAELPLTRSLTIEFHGLLGTTLFSLALAFGLVAWRRFQRRRGLNSVS